VQFFERHELDAIRAAGVVREISPGEILFHRGEVGDAMYVLEAGEIEISFEEGAPPKLLEPGEVFGEVAFILGRETRSATACATIASRVREVNQGAIDWLFDTQPRLLLQLLRRTCDYLLASENRLVEHLQRQNQELRRTLDYLRRTREELGVQELSAQTDDLTGLYNRRCFDLQVPRFVNRAAASGQGMGLMFVDLDHFKEVNDTFGHAAGDDVLRDVGRILAASVRSSDLPCRYGGDEFVIILGEIAASGARQRAEQTRQRLDAMPPVTDPAGRNGAKIRVTASIGMALWRPGETSGDLFARADRHLYQAKQNGRDRVVADEDPPPEAP